MIVQILKGLPASGKSTYAKSLDANWKRVNKDDLRAMIDGGKWSRKNEKFILQIRDNLILTALDQGKCVVVDDTNLAPKHEEHIKQLVKDWAKKNSKNVEVQIKFFDADLEECIARDLKRPVSVGEKVIRDMYNQFLKPAPAVYVPPIRKPKIVIFDIDGTLAKMEGRSPFDWSRVGEDKPNKPIVDILNMFTCCCSTYEVFIFSGRDEVCRELTENWLHDNGIQCKALFIRSSSGF